MILAFGIVLVILGLLSFTKKRLMRRHWFMLFLFGFVLAFLVSFVSVWSAWNPYDPSDTWRDGNYSGASALSYPLWMNVYTTPESQRTFQGWYLVGNVSFDVFIANERIIEANGTLSIPAVFMAHATYQLEFPFFSDGPSFFTFLLISFTAFNMTGVALGLILAFAVSRYSHHRKVLQ